MVVPGEAVASCYEVECTSPDCILMPYDCVPVEGEVHHLVIIVTEFNRRREVDGVVEVFCSHGGITLAPPDSERYMRCFNAWKAGECSTRDLLDVAMSSYGKCTDVPRCIFFRCVYRSQRGGSNRFEWEEGGSVIQSRITTRPLSMWRPPGNLGG